MKDRFYDVGIIILVMCLIVLAMFLSFVLFMTTPIWFSVPVIVVTLAMLVAVEEV
jgi:hypothetical protein